MKSFRHFTFFTRFVLVLLTASLWPRAHARAACKVACKRQEVIVAQDVVAVPVAVPVGVPVASYSPYYYSYQATAQTSLAGDTDAIAAAVVQRLLTSLAPAPNERPASGAARVESPAPQPASLVMQKCASCHSQGQATSKATAFGHFNPAATLTCEQRLAAARAVLSEQMPKGAKLSADEAGQVLNELIGK
jgi:mono/diheme cytochrome c family protein